MHLKVFGKVDATDRISDDPKGRRRDHHGHHCQTIQAIGKVHSIRRTHYHEHREGHKEETKIDQ